MDKDDKTETNKILILKILSNIEQLRNDFKEIKDEIKINNDFVTIKKEETKYNKNSYWFF
tara:strand:+ start:344 stop:523 length:180 start_codon:yes stop_codon:yes gene_type:complete